MSNVSLRLSSLYILLQNALPWLAWGLFIVSLFTPALYIPPSMGEHDTGGMALGIFALGVTPFLALLSIIGNIQQPSWLGMVLGIRLFSHTLGNFLLLILPFWSPYRILNVRKKVSYCLLMFICVFSALNILLAPNVLWQGARVQMGAYLWASAQGVLLIISVMALLRSPNNQY